MPNKRFLNIEALNINLIKTLFFTIVIAAFSLVVFSYLNLIRNVHATNNEVLGTYSLTVIADEDESYKKSGEIYNDQKLHFKRGENVTYINFDLSNLDQNIEILDAKIKLVPTEKFDNENNKIYAFMLNEEWNKKKDDVSEIISLLGTYDGDEFKPLGAVSGPLPPVSGNDVLKDFVNVPVGEGYIYKDGNDTIVDVTDIVKEQVRSGNYGMVLSTDAVDKDYTFWSSESLSKEPKLVVTYKTIEYDSSGIDEGGNGDDGTDNDGNDYEDSDGISEDPTGTLKPIHVVCTPGEKSFAGIDTYISGEDENKNFANEKELLVEAKLYKPLFYWDLSEIPRNSIIDSAKFTFNVKTTDSANVSYRFMGIAKNWKDDSGNVTWVNVNKSEKWQEPGANGDEDVNGIASVLRNVNKTGEYEADLRFLAIDWTNNPKENNGMIIEASGKSSKPQVIYSYDSDSKPNLTVKYRVCNVADDNGDDADDNGGECSFGSVAEGWNVFPEFNDASVFYRYYETGNGFQKIESKREGVGIYQTVLLAENKYYEISFDADVDKGGVNLILKDSVNNQSTILRPGEVKYIQTSNDFVPDELYVLTSKSESIVNVRNVSVKEITEEEFNQLNNSGNDSGNSDDEEGTDNEENDGTDGEEADGIVNNCGNGVIDEGEECDDGNTSNKDGCSALCKVEKGYECDNSVSPSACELTEAGSAVNVCVNSSDVSKEECLALAKLFESTNGNEWKDNTGWLADSSVCNWYGITCSDDKKHVTEIDLTDNSLAGKISAGLSVLKSLEILDLSNNELTGKLPADLLNMNNLKVLNLGNNKLAGDVKEFSILSSLIALNISANDFEGEFPSEFTDMVNLEKLELYQNNIRGEIPEKIGNLSNLKVLSIANNSIEGNIPKSVSELKKLEVFHAQDNNLSCDIPEEVTALESMKKGEFDITNNRLNVKEDEMNGDLVEWLDTYAGGNWRNQNEFNGECDE